MQLDAVIEVAKGLQAEGETVSQNAVLARAGGSKRDLSRLWPSVLEAIGEPVPEPVPTLAEQFTMATATRAAAHHRLNVLNALALNQVLSEEEEAEQVRLERRLLNLAPVLQQLEHRLARQRQRADIDAVLEAWAPLVDMKHEAYEAFVEAENQLWRAFAHIVDVHVQQAQVLTGLPREAQEKLGFPDPQSLKMRIASRMPRWVA